MSTGRFVPASKLSAANESVHDAFDRLPVSNNPEFSARAQFLFGENAVPLYPNQQVPESVAAAAKELSEMLSSVSFPDKNHARDEDLKTVTRYLQETFKSEGVKI
jgi:hypothetical protein